MSAPLLARPTRKLPGSPLKSALPPPPARPLQDFSRTCLTFVGFMLVAAFNFLLLLAPSPLDEPAPAPAAQPAEEAAEKPAPPAATVSVV